MCVHACCNVRKRNVVGFLRTEKAVYMPAVLQSQWRYLSKYLGLVVSLLITPNYECTGLRGMVPSTEFDCESLQNNHEVFEGIIWRDLDFCWWIMPLALPQIRMIQMIELSSSHNDWSCKEYKKTDFPPAWGKRSLVLINRFSEHSILKNAPWDLTKFVMQF